MSEEAERDLIVDSIPEVHLTNYFLFNPAEGERFVTCVPFYELEAAAGSFGPEQPIPETADHRCWVRVEGHGLTKEMFAIRVVGRSMEPRIPKDSICLFRGGEGLAGTRQGRMVLVELRDAVDPESGGRLFSWCLISPGSPLPAP